MSEAKVIGRVDSAYTSKSTQITNLKVYVSRLDKTLKVVIPPKYKCWVQVGDSIAAICEVEEIPLRRPDTDGNMSQTVLTAIRPPWIEVGVAKKTVTDCFLRFLSGTGFGNSKANKLYDRLAEQATQGQTPSSINEIQGIAVAYLNYLAAEYNKSGNSDFFPIYEDIVDDKQMAKLLKKWYGQRSVRRLYLLGLKKADIKKLHRCSHDDVYLRCMDNAFTIPEISQEQAVEIFHRINKEYTKDDYRRGLIVRKIYEEAQRGNTAVMTRYLKRSFPDLGEHTNELLADYGIVIDRGAYYLKYQHQVEVEMAEFLAEAVFESYQAPEPTEPSYTITTLTRDQKEGVRLALRDRVSIITGHPGCGKTLTIREIIHNLDLAEVKYAIASFTGKAVARLREVVGDKNISTMHKMIAKPPPGGFDVLILDEVSMITTELMWTFMQKFGDKFAIVLVGDIDQLPPISWGNMFKELIMSNTADTVRLTKNYRVVQDYENNGILENAKQIVDWDPENPSCPDRFDFLPANNFTVVESNDASMIFQIVNGLLQVGNTAKDIRVISPYNDPLVKINQACQTIYNSEQDYVIDKTKDKTMWRIGDLVAMTSNNYDINVMNGEEGEVVGVSYDNDTIDCFFEGHGTFSFSLIPPKQDYGDWDDWSTPEGKVKRIEDSLNVTMLTHCFGITVHKSQGSEFKHVIFYLEPRHKHGNFINKNLIYTGITRAKDTVHMVGDIEGLLRGCTTPPSSRYDALGSRISEIICSRCKKAQAEIKALTQEPELLTDDEDEFGDCGYGDW